jgi:predicted ribosomally synthesized peptide with nif11-like leader
MSEQQLNALLSELKTNSELRNKLQAAATPEAALSLAREAGYEVDMTDWQAFNDMGSDLNDEDLEDIAGGKGNNCNVTQCGNSVSK